ncbi:hypothetical protein [Rathayibacter iranicus]|uniref:Uncharacterized protein n=2 Tax=Rathayibacter iranicus TaxID=59737 RepID=A0AAD1EMA0_9MICO|nr:hypothetical protein [Rathayibacter iranicus]AZZ55888.1 hypothetical protein C7V51_08380 [Rathayibacter iranicus]MWV30671.1 hypothetical protein [Rathayibacter iranicus NCPPB 2253 = VKM Ac-1602]PPI47212.1 hypothetical protein C5E09_07415 [Rathayibacter iranicus]PPI60255.1 hypothetical protein C5E08_08345 [Rathayibacter iranicus]PPI71720.1 hypothetical protein C5E01_07385 [Rathayibacter iranicus]
MTETQPGPRPTAVRRALSARRLTLLVGLVVVAVGLVILALVPLQYWTLSTQGFDDACNSSLGGVPPESGELVRGFWSWWPLGEACEWTLLDGTYVIDRPDSSTTAVAIIGAVLLLAGIGLTIASRFLSRRVPAEA